MKPPCRCPRYPFPHRWTGACDLTYEVRQELRAEFCPERDREGRREIAKRCAADAMESIHNRSEK